MKYIYFLLTLILFNLSSEEVPVSYNGRFRPLENYIQLRKSNNEMFWSEFHNQTQIIHDDKSSIQEKLNDHRTLLPVLPGHFKQGEWFSLESLKLTDGDKLIGNFTQYSDEMFRMIQERYLTWDETQNIHDRDELIKALHNGYATLAGQPIMKVNGKTLTYPTLLQLKLERLYYQIPLIKIAMGIYCLAALLLFLGDRRRMRKLAFAALILAFLIHSALLLLRIFILERPPVSNMFETVIYVPWVMVGLSLVLMNFYRNWLLPFASAIGAVTLLILIQVTGLNNGLDNVQAVLDSQFWLIIHVLMVVGSYGVFILAGLLGHFYLIKKAFFLEENSEMKSLANVILQCLYVGTVLLISGTILGGVWAAESWGRFWDWDPKEAWAFITSCIYLIWIHAYRFNKIGHLGLAYGSILGLLAVSFTWYGVNYILGTGLHSYGFGSGGEIYYYLYLFGELLFVAIIYVILRTKTRINNNGEL